MKLQMLKKALIAYVTNSAKAIWSAVAHPLTIEGKKNCNVADYRIYGNSVQNGEPTPEAPIEVQSVGELTTKNLLDVNSVYPNYVNDEGGISYTNSDMGKIYQADMMNEYKEDTVYTLSFDYSVEGNSGNSASVIISYTDETNTRAYLYVNTSGSKTMTSSSGKTIKSIKIAYSTLNVRCNVKLTNMQLEESSNATEYEPYHKYKVPITVRGRNYFDLDKVPFSNSTTQPYNNGIKATKLAAANRGDKIPIDLPVGKTIYLTLDVVDSKIEGTTARVSLDYLDGKGSRVRNQIITATIAHKTYSFTLSEEVKYIQFYFQSDNERNAVGDYVTMDNIMFRTEGEDVWEAYVKPQTVNIYLDEPLRTGQVMQKSKDNLPSLPQFEGTTVYEAQTEIPPSGIAVQYYG